MEKTICGKNSPEDLIFSRHIEGVDAGNVLFVVFVVVVVVVIGLMHR